MFELIGNMFSYGFLNRALLVGGLVALCAALLGVVLVLRRYSMIGDGLSHVGFGALSIAMAMNLAPLAVAVPVVVIAAFLLLMFIVAPFTGANFWTQITNVTLFSGTLTDTRSVYPG